MPSSRLIILFPYRHRGVAEWSRFRPVLFFGNSLSQPWYLQRLDQGGFGILDRPVKILFSRHRFDRRSVLAKFIEPLFIGEAGRYPEVIIQRFSADCTAHASSERLSNKRDNIPLKIISGTGVTKSQIDSGNYASKIAHGL